MDYASTCMKIKDTLQSYQEREISKASSSKANVWLYNWTDFHYTENVYRK